jgi:hypothetical protein
MRFRVQISYSTCFLQCFHGFHRVSFGFHTFLIRFGGLIGLHLGLVLRFTVSCLSASLTGLCLLFFRFRCAIVFVYDSIVPHGSVEPSRVHESCFNVFGDYDHYGTYRMCTRVAPRLTR